MKAECVVEVAHLSKRFKIFQSPLERAKEWLSLRKHRYHHEFWALQDISFHLNQAEILGIIGQNGAGKTTLLKILTGVLYPTSGSFHIKGKALSLLELGTGFNPDLTGHQNIIHSSQVLGFSESYIKERLPEIETFAELGDFIHRPLKFYSTGMRARLGFSLFAFLECSTLIIDEVLSVGDVFFRQKCYARLQKLIEQNTSIILATHSIPAIQDYCHKVMVLHHGRATFLGPPLEAARHYLNLERQLNGPKPLPPSARDADHSAADQPQPRGEKNSPLDFWPPTSTCIDIPDSCRKGGRFVRSRHVALCDENGEARHIFEQGQWAYLYCEYDILKDIGVPIFQINLRNDKNILIHAKSTLQQTDIKTPSFISQGNRIRILRTIKLDITPGEYTIAIIFTTMAPEDYKNVENMTHQEIISKSIYLEILEGFISLNITSKSQGTKFLHYGICNLPGENKISIISRVNPDSVK